MVKHCTKFQYLGEKHKLLSNDDRCEATSWCLSRCSQCDVIPTVKQLTTRKFVTIAVSETAPRSINTFNQPTDLAKSVHLNLHR